MTVKNEIFHLKEKLAQRISERKRSGQWVRAVCTSATGLVRGQNEDNFFFDGRYMPQVHQSLAAPYSLTYPLDECPPLAVLDGMGGENAGELASYTGALWLAENRKTLLVTEKGLTNALRQMNRSVCEAARAGRYGSIGSTISMLTFMDDKIWSCNLGDSPIYLLRGGKMTMLAEMHTDADILKEMGISRKPGLTQYLGVREEECILEPTVSCIDAREGDLLLICSDGLTDMVSEEELRELLMRKGDLQRRMDRCMRQALAAGGIDNITIILCEIAGEV